MQKTTNFNLNKPDLTDFYDIADFNENADIIDSVLAGKSEKVRLDYSTEDGFVKDGETLNFKEIYDLLMDSVSFVFVVYGDRSHLPTFINDDGSIKEIRFASIIINDSIVKTQSIYVTSNDGIEIANVQIVNVNSENSSNKVTSLAGANNTTYPTTKAVADAVEGANDHIEDSIVSEEGVHGFRYNTETETTQAFIDNEWVDVGGGGGGSTIPITFTVEGAKEDNITITPVSGGDSIPVVFDSGATSKEVTMMIPNEGGDYTFESSVAKAVDGSGDNYSLNVTLTQSTDVVKVYPEDVGFWLGNFNGNKDIETFAYGNWDSNHYAKPTVTDTENSIHIVVNRYSTDSTSSASMRNVGSAIMLDLSKYLNKGYTKMNVMYSGKYTTTNTNNVGQIVSLHAFSNKPNAQPYLDSLDVWGKLLIGYSDGHVGDIKTATHSVVSRDISEHTDKLYLGIVQSVNNMDAIIDIEQVWFE